MHLTRALTNVLSTGLDVYNCIIYIFMIFSLLETAKTNKAHRYFVFVCISVFVFNIADMANWCCEGFIPAWHIPVLHILTFVYYFILPIIFYFIVKYIEEFLSPHNNSSVFIKILLFSSIFYYIGVLITPFTGFYYFFTPDNYYVRGKYNYVSFIFYILFYVLITVLIISNKKKLSSREFWTFLSFPILPAIAEIIQIKFYGLALVNMGMTLSILLIFLNIHTNLENSYLLKEIEAETNEKKLIQFQEHTIISLSNLVENRDTETGEHARRTSLFVELLARKTLNDGFYTDIINDRYIELLVKAAPMHDIGKIVVSDTVLKKAGKLNENEYEAIKHHAEEGGRIVNDIIGLTDDKEYVQIAVDIAQSHHERWDGQGYPNKLRGAQIPLSARIMAVADVFDALVFERCYKKPIPPEEAFKILESEAGSHFDPILIHEFLKIKEEILRIIHIYQD